MSLEFPNPPLQFTVPDFNRLLLFAISNDISDIHIQSGLPITVDLYGKLLKVTKRALSVSEVSAFLEANYGQNAMIALMDGRSLDFSYETKDENRQRNRFRINATSCLYQGKLSIQVTIRSIPSKPIKLEDLNIEPEIIESFLSKQGMVLVTGGTGSGKSTLLSSCIRHIVEQEDSNVKIVTYESPIEFVYDDIVMPSSIISQSEVPKHVSSFSVGVESALRRKPDIILVGEARDKETIEASILAAQTGHMLYTTTHTNGVVETIRRLATIFPSEEQEARIIDIISSIRMIVSQRLLPRISGGRIAIREYLIFTNAVKKRLLLLPLNMLNLEIANILIENKTSMIDSARSAFSKGEISRDNLDFIIRSYT